MTTRLTQLGFPVPEPEGGGLERKADIAEF